MYGGQHGSSEWMADALALARAQGRVGGRKPTMTPKKLDAARRLLASGSRPREVASAIGVSIATLYRHVPAAGARVEAAAD